MVFFIFLKKKIKWQTLKIIKLTKKIYILSFLNQNNDNHFICGEVTGDEDGN